MVRLARAELFDPSEVAMLHVMGRVVRRCLLFGFDRTKSMWSARMTVRMSVSNRIVSTRLKFWLTDISNSWKTQWCGLAMSRLPYPTSMDVLVSGKTGAHAAAQSLRSSASCSMMIS